LLNWTLTDLLPHAGNMILLDELLSCDDDAVHTRVTVRPCLFSDGNGELPGWIGLELMAQSVAAWAGVRAKRAGQPVELGFLIGTRKYECNVPVFPNGRALHIHARASLEDASGLGVFECELTGDGIHASARLNVYRPPQVADYLYEAPDALPA